MPGASIRRARCPGCRRRPRQQIIEYALTWPPAAWMMTDTRSRIGWETPADGVLGAGQGMADRAGGERRTGTGEEVLATVDVPSSDLQRPP